MDDVALTLFRISGRFEQFLDVCGLDPDHDVVGDLKSNLLQINVEQEAREYVVAWTAYQMLFSRKEMNVVWFLRPYRSTNVIGHVADMMRKLAPLFPLLDFYKENQRILQTHHGNRLTKATVSEHAMRGMSINVAIVEDAHRPHEAFNQALMPSVMARSGRIIELV